MAKFTHTVFALIFILCGLFSFCKALAPAPAPGTSVLPTQECYSYDQGTESQKTCYQLSDAEAAHSVLLHFYSTNRAYNFTQLGWSNRTHPCGGQTLLTDQVNDTASTEESLYSIYDTTKTSWVGVSCDGIDVEGKSSSDQFFLTSWKMEKMEMRELEGDVPDAFGNLTNLKELSIWQMPKLSGPIPISIMKLRHLEKLTLASNNHSGSFPVDGDLPNLQYLDISNNNFSGDLPLQGSDYIKLQHFDASHNKFHGFSVNWCTYTYPSYDQLTYLNLSNNHFIGTFCTSIFKAVQVIDLSKNSFTNIQSTNSTYDNQYNEDRNLRYGIQFLHAQDNLIATFPTNVFQWSSLLSINLDNNQLTGLLVLPFIYSGNSSLNGISLVNNSITSLQTSEQSGSLLSESSLKNVEIFLFLGGNPICKNQENHELEDLLRFVCRYDKSSPIPPAHQIAQAKKSNKVLIVAIATSSSTLVMIFSIILAFVMKKLMKQTSLLQEIEKEFAKRDVKPNLYTYSELKMATQDFHVNNKLGAGGYGVVYKGILHDGSRLAVKRLTIKTDQALEDFFNEIVAISSIKHRNLVQLKGCCVKGDNRFLVYELVENKNLAEALWECPVEERFQLDWKSRFNIIIGVARGLMYLHEDVQPAIVHRDIKPPNILLDKNYNPKIADFGLALLFPELDDDQTHQSMSKVAGTRGYLSPEYATFGQLSTKLDIFSFGILILEIVSGRKIIDFNLPIEQRYLFDWAKKLQEMDEMPKLIDTTILNTIVQVDTIKKVMNVALLCIQYLPVKRPSMSEVVDMLLGNRDIECISSQKNQNEKALANDNIELMSFHSSSIVEEENTLFDTQIERSI